MKMNKFICDECLVCVTRMTMSLIMSLVMAQMKCGYQVPVKKHIADESDVEEGGPMEVEDDIDFDDDIAEAEDALNSVTQAVIAQTIIKYTGRVGTVWSRHAHNVFRPKRNLTIKDTFKRIFWPQMCSIIINETNRNGQMVVEEYNNIQAKYMVGIVF